MFSVPISLLKNWNYLLNTNRTITIEIEDYVSYEASLRFDGLDWESNRESKESVTEREINNSQVNSCDLKVKWADGRSNLTEDMNYDSKQSESEGNKQSESNNNNQSPNLLLSLFVHNKQKSKRKVCSENYGELMDPNLCTVLIDESYLKIILSFLAESREGESMEREMNERERMNGRESVNRENRVNNKNNTARNKTTSIHKTTNKNKGTPKIKISKKLPIPPIRFLIAFFASILPLMATFFVCSSIIQRFSLKDPSLESFDINSTEILKFNQIDSPGSNCCPICFDTFEEAEIVHRLPCSHIFHPNCVKVWLVGHSQCCPYCRKPIEVFERE